MKQKLFKMLEWHNNGDVLGGAVEYENCYISCYPKVLKVDFHNKPQKPIAELEINEFVYVEMSLSGSKGIYRIMRVQ